MKTLGILGGGQLARMLALAAPHWACGCVRLIKLLTLVLGR